jgi:hypothetical protein
VKSFIGKAKRSVDSTVDAYLGRAAFAISILCAIGFALAGTWLVLVDLYGTTVTCFVLAGILVVLSFIINLTIVASERSAERDIKEVEKTIKDSGLVAASSLPFELSTVVTVLPTVLPLLKSLRAFLPFVIVAALVASYFLSTEKSAEQQQPVAVPQ